MHNEHGPDMQYLQKVLLEMLAIPCPTGFTDGIVRYVAEHLDEMGVPYELTRRGTIRATLKGQQSSPDRAIASHLDTIGAMVSEIKDNGRLKLAPIGCWSSRFAEGSRVSVFTETGCFRGSVLPLMASGHAFNTEVDTLPELGHHRATAGYSLPQPCRDRSPGRRRRGFCSLRSLARIHRKRLYQRPSPGQQGRRSGHAHHHKIRDRQR